MVQPIDYTMNVLNPIEGYMQGLKFGEDVLTARQGRAASAQNMRIQQATFEEQQRERAEQRAAAQRAMEAANQGQAALMEYYNKLEAGTATPSDLRRAVVSFPGMAEQFQAVANSFSSERLANETRFGKELSFSIARGNIDTARSILDERVAAAEAAGDAQAAATYKSQLMMLDQDPNGLLMQSLMPLSSTLPADEFDKFYTNVLGLGPQRAEAVSPIGKIAQDVENGIIPRSVLDTAVRLEEKQGEDGLTLQQKIAEEARLRGEYTKRTEDLAAAERNFQIIQTSAADNSGAGDIALVTSFMKMLDPGSVVRETEFATAANAGGLLGRLKAIATKVENGQFLSPEQRADFERLAGQYLSAAQKQEGPVRENYQAIIENYGLNPVNVFGARAATQAPAGTAETAAETPQEPAPPSFGSDPRIQALIEKYGLTAQDMWDAMTPEQRARYGK